MRRAALLLALPFATLAGPAACGAEDRDVDVGLDDGSVPPAPDGAALGDAGPKDAGVTRDAAPKDAGPLNEAGPPNPPTFPATIDVLSVDVRTAAAAGSGTDDPVEICLNGTKCFPLATPSVDEFQPGKTDTFHIANVAVKRADVDRITLRGPTGDRFVPSCIDVRFDGEPVYCNDALGGKSIGSGSAAGESRELRDDVTNRARCESCLSGPLGGKLPSGPMVGAPTNDKSRVWVRTDATRLVGLQVASKADGSDAKTVDWAYPKPTDDFTAVLETPPLAGPRAYYRVLVDGARGEPFRPLPIAPDVDAPIRLATASCAARAEQPAYEALARERLDLMVYLGDNHYGNTPYLGGHRWNYRRLEDVPGRRELLSEVATLATWDDHDFVANNSDGLCGGREAALRGFKEAWVNPSYGTAQTPGVFTKASYGPVDVFLTDCRTYRPRVPDPGRNCSFDDPPATPLSSAAGPLGEDQFTWLVNALDASTAPFKLIGCGSTFRGGWSNFPGSRDRLFSAIERRGIRGVVLLSGDIHHSELVVHRRAGTYDIPEFISSPLGNYGRIGTYNKNLHACDGNDPNRFGCYVWNNYVTVDVDSASDRTLTAQIHAESGAVRATYRVKQSALR